LRTQASQLFRLDARSPSGEDCLGKPLVGRPSDFEGIVVARYDMDGATHRLDKPSVIGDTCGAVVEGQPMCLEQGRSPETLRRLDGPQHRTIRGVDHAASLNLLEGIDHGEDGNHSVKTTLYSRNDFAK
jgi:hypothetical protein